MNTLYDKSKIDKNKIPAHVAIIMDGNGRWAKKQNQDRIFGHQHGVESVRNACEIATELGIKYLTLYTFSKENWNRPQKEVEALMQMLVYTIAQEEKTLMDNDIRLETIGDTMGLGEQARDSLLNMIEKTKNNKRMTLILALNYSARWEIIEMTKQISSLVAEKKLRIEDITEETVSNHLTTKSIPDVDLLIRTSGEERISNFLLWQIAYSELFFTPVLWPDFTKQDFIDAVVNYQSRERRFGKTSEQISK